MNSRWTVVLLALLSAACGGSSLSPLSPAPAIELAPGRYNLHIRQAPSQSTSPYDASLCLTAGTGPNAGSVLLAVDVARDGDRWMVHTINGGTLVAELQARGSSLFGTLQGQASSNGVTVSVGGDPNLTSAASLSGLAGPESISGSIDGHVSFAGGGGSQSCSGNAFTLTPQ